MQTDYTSNDIARFWGKVDKECSQIFYNNTRCWEWTGAKNSGGYGVMRVGNIQCYTHRISFELSHGRIVEDFDVLHHCDNRCCVRPEHLWLGTDQDNVDDKTKKGRAYYPGAISPLRGEMHPTHKLSLAQVSEIRRRYGYRGRGGDTVEALAREFASSESQILRIVKHESWK